MGFGSALSYGAVGANEALEKILARRIEERNRQQDLAQRAIENRFRQQGFDQASENQRLQREFQAAQLQNLIQNQRGIAQDRENAQGTAEADQIPAGTKFSGLMTPTMGRLRSRGLLSPEGLTGQEPPAGIAALNLPPMQPIPGTVASSPFPAGQGYIKSASQRQLEAIEKTRHDRAMEDTPDPFTAFQQKYDYQLANPKPAPAATATGRLDKSYQLSVGQLEKVRQPLVQQADRFARLGESVNQKTPQADALLAPEFLTAMAGGMGSGLRMNEAEIARIVGGRTHFESLKATLNKWQLDPSKGLTVTDAQRDQMRTLMSTVQERLIAKLSVLDRANQELIDAPDVNTHRQILQRALQNLTKIDQEAARGTGPAPDLTGLQPGTARRFTEGPFAGQRWTLSPNGQPQQLGP